MHCQIRYSLVASPQTGNDVCQFSSVAWLKITVLFAAAHKIKLLVAVNVELLRDIEIAS